MIEGINHITLAVSDLENSLGFYVGLLGFALKGRWDKGAYLLAGNQWIALNVDTKGLLKPREDYSHLAFQISPANFPAMKKRLEAAGVKSFQENTSEGDSFYFLDPDGHKLELHYNTLEDRLKWAKEINWTGFEFFD